MPFEFIQIPANGQGSAKEELNRFDRVRGCPWQGEHTRPRVFRGARSHTGGWCYQTGRKFGMLHRVTQTKFPARAPETTREGACAPPSNWKKCAATLEL